MFLDEPKGVASILDKLLKGDKNDVLLAYQVAFDLFENEYQKFLLNVRDLLPEPASVPTITDMAVPNGGRSGNGISAMTGGGGPTAMDTDVVEEIAANPAEEAETETAIGPPAPERTPYAERLLKLKGILSGETPSA